MAIKDTLKKIVEKEDMTLEESEASFNEIMSGAATPAQIGSFITALRMKGETIDEITGAAKVMREKATCVKPENPEFIVDTCGTGGDGANTFNVSTASAFVAAGAGSLVAKHGNRSVSSKSGSADVLEALGIDISIGPEKMKECLDEVGISFLFAPVLHKAMKYAIAPRREIGLRTIFNILGPLTNPSMADNHLIGIFLPGLTEMMARVLNNLGSSRAFIVHGQDGLDEISVCAATRVSELAEKRVKTYNITPEQYGIERSEQDSVKGGDSQENAKIITDVLKGRNGPQRDIVVINAGFAIAASGRAKTPEEGIKKAIESIDSGAAREKLEQLKSKCPGKV